MNSLKGNQASPHGGSGVGCRGGKTSILFVCLGNICRSPAAEAVMKKKLEDRWPLCAGVEVDSAGIGSWHEGQLPDRRMRRHGAARGYDVGSVARQVKAEDFARFDYIFGMDHDNMADLRRLARTEEERSKVMCAADFMARHPQYDTVPDPYYGGGDAFELALDLIEDACDGIINRLFADS